MSSLTRHDDGHSQPLVDSNVDRGVAVYYCLATVAVAVAIALVDDGGARWLAVLASFVLLGAYFALCQPRVAGLHTNSATAWAYTGIAFVVVALNSYVAPTTGSFILFVVCPQFVYAMTFGATALLIVAVNAVYATFTVWSAGTEVLGSTVVTAAGVAVAVTYFSYRAVQRAEQSAERGRLIEELTRTRDEAAALRAEQAVSAERERISRDVHDTVAQGFASILMLVQAVDAEISDQPVEARRHADMVKRIAAENLEESRRLVSALAPASLDELSLEAAIADVAHRFEDETSVAVSFTIEGASVAIDKPMQVVVLRFCQEALANVRKHAHASSVKIRLEYRRDEMVVSVADDGRGFDGRSYGYGLRGLITRVGEISGTVQIHSVFGGGTTVTAVLPTAEVPGGADELGCASEPGDESASRAATSVSQTSDDA